MDKLNTGKEGKKAENSMEKWITVLNRDFIENKF